MKLPLVSLDESGSLANANDPLVAVAWIADADVRAARIIISRAARAWDRRRGKREPVSEFKFQRAHELARRKVLQELVREQIRFGILIVDKAKQMIGDTPENYAALMAKAIAMAQNYFGAANLEIILDGHFSNRNDRERFVSLLVDGLDLSEQPRLADSHATPLAQLADFVAGAFYAKHGERKTLNMQSKLRVKRLWKCELLGKS